MAVVVGVVVEGVVALLRLIIAAAAITNDSSGSRVVGGADIALLVLGVVATEGSCGEAITV
jgi:hypothetical protein